MALLDFPNGYTCFSLFTMFFMLSLGSTKKYCVAQKNVVSTKKMFDIEVNVAQQSCETQKNMLCMKEPCWLNMFSVTQKRNTCFKKMVPFACKYTLNSLKKFCVARKFGNSMSYKS